MPVLIIWLLIVGGGININRDYMVQSYLLG